MSDAPDKDQKSFDPTARRLAKAREEGQTASSKDLAGSLQLLTALVLLSAVGGTMLRDMGLGVQLVLERMSAGGGRGFSITGAFSIAATYMLVPAIGFTSLCAAAVVFAQWSQTKFNWSPKALKFKWEALDITKRFGQVFNPKKMGVGLILSMLKLTVASIAVYTVFLGDFVPIATLSLTTPETVMARLADSLGSVAAVATTLFLGVSGIDLAWQRHQLWEQLKMTREEIKEENTEQEGNPQLKGRRKKMHRDLTMNQILNEVPRATVVVTNPTHLAVVLRYEQGVDAAPKVTARGADELAAHIRRLAREHGVPIIEHKPLARVLWKRVKVGQRVPSNLYQAVAEVLARVYRARAARGQSIR